jgi:hypothetical protein
MITLASSKVYKISPSSRREANLRHVYRSNRFRHRPPLPRRHVRLSRLRENLFGLMSSWPFYRSFRLQKPYFREDHFSWERPSGRGPHDSSKVRISNHLGTFSARRKRKRIRSRPSRAPPQRGQTRGPTLTPERGSVSDAKMRRAKV